METDLRGLRREALSDFLYEHLDPLMVSFTILENTENDEIRLSLSAMSGGEREFDLLTASINWEDFTDVPLLHLLSYLGVGHPYAVAGL